MKDWLDNLNDIQIGIFLLAFGIGFVFFFRFLHSKWKNMGYKPFKPFRRDNKTQSEDNFVIIMYIRTLIGIYIGYIIIFFGVLKIFSHFGIINF